MPRGHAPGVAPALVAAATEALRDVLAFDAPADHVLRGFFRRQAHLGRRDRGFIAESVFGCLRRLAWYSHLAGGRDPRRLVLLTADRLALLERERLAAACRPAEREWLERCAQASDENLPLEIRAELPSWALSAMAASMDERVILAIGRAMQRPAPLDLRVNTLVATRDEVLARLAESGIGGEAMPFAPNGVRITGKPALERHPLYLEGKVEVQEEGSQLVGHLLAPKRREMVADLCAGAGGKTLLLGALMRSEGRLYAFDVSAQRVHRLRARLARSGLSNVQPEAIAHENDARLKRLAGKLDRVLVDAPCTGFGTLRRNPDLKWRQQPADLEELTRKQASILDRASRLLKPGGVLVYATCSFLPPENDAVVDAFLAAHGEFEEQDAAAALARQGIGIDSGRRLRLFPHTHGTDAFFAALLRRRA